MFGDRYRSIKRSYHFESCLKELWHLQLWNMCFLNLQEFNFPLKHVWLEKVRTPQKLSSEYLPLEISWNAENTALNKIQCLLLKGDLSSFSNPLKQIKFFSIIETVSFRLLVSFKCSYYPVHDGNQEVGSTIPETYFQLPTPPISSWNCGTGGETKFNSLSRHWYRENIYQCNGHQRIIWLEAFTVQGIWKTYLLLCEYWWDFILFV